MATGRSKPSTAKSSSAAPRRTSASNEGDTLTAITISGFKSIREPRTLELSALNILAGANSSGKSSFMQPLLLLKQTLEASYDPGPLLLDGPNVKFTELAQFFSSHAGTGTTDLHISFSFGDGSQFGFVFDQGDKKQHVHLRENIFVDPRGKTLQLTQQTKMEEIREFIQSGSDATRVIGGLLALVLELKKDQKKFERRRCFLEMDGFNSSLLSPAASNAESFCSSLIHVPGLRGQPDRRYKHTATGLRYPGTLDTYVASIIHNWKENSDPRLHTLSNQLQQLGLTWKVDSNQLDASSLELRVGRLPQAQRGGAKDLVSIADVGFGVSQVLPVLVALLVAEARQLVYIEQPETHLHPKAQRALAGVFAEAITRGAIVVVETHSLLFVRAVQTLVAKQQMPADKVKLHWVQRDAKGDTQLTTCQLDNAGAYGDWPQDFEETEMQSEQDYIEAAEAVLLRPHEQN